MFETQLYFTSVNFWTAAELLLQLQEVLYTASWALRWFQHHRSLTRARQAALAAARKHHAVENNSSALHHGAKGPGNLRHV